MGDRGTSLTKSAVYPYALTCLAGAVLLAVCSCTSDTAPASAPTPTPTLAVARAPIPTPTAASAPTPAPTVAHTPTPTPTQTNTPTPTSTPEPASYVITALDASQLATSDGLVSTEFTVDVINAGGLGGLPTVPVFMSIGDEAPQQVRELDRPDSGKTVSFAVTGALPVGQHTVSFTIGDSEREIEVDVRAADIVLEHVSHSIAGEDSIDLSVRVTNQGDLLAEMVSVQVFWEVSGSDAEEDSGTGHKSVVIDALVAGGSRLVSLPLSIPSGSHALSLEAETESIEVLRGNNTDEAIVEVEYVSLVPSIQSTSVTGYELDGKGIVEVTLSVNNRGVASSGPIRIGFTCEDLAIEECSRTLEMASIPPGASASIQATVTLPEGENQVTLFAGAPDDGYRWGEDNVQQAAIVVPFRPAAYSIETADTAFVAIKDGLVVTEFSIAVRNVGGSAGPLLEPVLITTNENEPESVHVIGRPESGESVEFVITRDLALGRHSVAFEIADAVQVIEVDVGAADVIVEPLHHEIVGDWEMALSARVTNLGDRTAETVKVFAARKEAADIAGPGSAQGPTSVVIEALSPVESQVIALPVRVPPGPHTLVLEVETESIEVRKDNNTAETDVEVDYVQLVPFAQSTRVVGYMRGGDAIVEIPLLVANEGVASSWPIEVGVACLEDSTVGCSQVYVVDSIPPGGEAALTATFSLPPGTTPITVFAGALEEGYRWGDANVLQTSVVVPRRKAGTPYMTPEEAIEALPWVKDGISNPRNPNVGSTFDPPQEREEHVIDTLRREYKAGSRDLFWAFIRKPWFQDGLDHVERNFFYELVRYDERSTVAILGMPFMETVEEGDMVVRESFEVLSSAGLLPSLVAHPDLRNGITDDKMATAVLAGLDLLRPREAALMQTWPWIRDGVSEAELRGLRALRLAAMESEQVFWALSDKPWVRDGLSRSEANVIWHLVPMGSTSYSNSNIDAALAIIDMPFLETVDDLDSKAIESLGNLTYTFSTFDGALNGLLSHPILHGGVTDEQTSRLSFLSIVSSAIRSHDEAPAMDIMSSVMNPDLSTLEERKITLPLAGDVLLTALHSANGADAAMDSLEHAVRTQEALMGVPFPVDRVRMWLSPELGGPGGGSRSGDIYIDKARFYQLHGIIAHETAHIYSFGGVPSWIAEGGATFMEILSEHERIGAPTVPLRGGRCDSYSTLRELEEFDVHYRDFCNYSMGSAFFFDLYHSLGEDVFREGFAELYLILRADTRTLLTERRCTGREFSVCYLKNAFVKDADPESAAIAEPIIDRWYYGADGKDE